MFPEHARFICRRYLTAFYVSSSNFKQARETNAVQCPECGDREEARQWVKRFFTFYPRLSASINEMREKGLQFMSYDFKFYDLHKMFLFENLYFKCAGCHWDFVFRFNNIEEHINAPEKLLCRHCGRVNILKRETKEFCMSLRNVHESTQRFASLQWDIFHPLRLDPANYAIQWNKYKKEA